MRYRKKPVRLSWPDLLFRYGYRRCFEKARQILILFILGSACEQWNSSPGAAIDITPLFLRHCKSTKSFPSEFTYIGKFTTNIAEFRPNCLESVIFIYVPFM